MTQANKLASVGSSGVSQGFKNRIINGDMRIDQRNAGASVTPSNADYTLDRWSPQFSQSNKISVQQVTDAPTGFLYSSKITSLSAYSVVAGDYFLYRQHIEGYNSADFKFGTANASNITISFWVKSSLTGNFSVSVFNNDGTRSYPALYTISSANTWEYKTITIAGSTNGTWGTTNGIGVSLGFGLGGGSTFSSAAGVWNTNGSWTPHATGATSLVGTSGATLYITGVQLEVGTTATEFERRDYTRELQLCQRYYWRITGGYGIPAIGTGMNLSASGARVTIQNPVQMRTGPSYSYSGNLYMLQNNGNGVVVTNIGAIYAGLNSSMLQFNIGSNSVTQGDATLICIDNSASYYFDGFAEL
jgi:hypothetical protein